MIIEKAVSKVESLAQNWEGREPKVTIVAHRNTSNCLANFFFFGDNKIRAVSLKRVNWLMEMIVTGVTCGIYEP